MNFYISLVTVLAILSRVPGAKCLSTSTCAFPTSIAGPDTNIHSVTIGAAGRLAFSPPRLDVAVGDTVLFDFLALNHSLTQSSLQDPCSWNSTGGFDTGFKQFNPKNISGAFVVEYTVETSKPLWFFCSQVHPMSHCRKGMIFALNPGVAFGTFVQAATGTFINTRASNTQAPAYTKGSMAASSIAYSTGSRPALNPCTQSPVSKTTPALSPSVPTGSAISPTTVSEGGYTSGRFRLIMLSFVLAVANA